uniref:Uncharacterized protein n=3 Tax=Canis lupus TaxID=9612 RepID=A0A8C0S8M6_CANLF
MSRASLTSSSSWYSASCCCITSRISVISCSLASSILRNLSRSPAMVSSSSRIRSSAALAWQVAGDPGPGQACLCGSCRDAHPAAASPHSCLSRRAPTAGKRPWGGRGTEGPPSMRFVARLQPSRLKEGPTAGAGPGPWPSGVTCFWRPESW